MTYRTMTSYTTLKKYITPGVLCSPGLCVCVCLSSFSLCNYSDQAQSEEMAVDQNQVEGRVPGVVLCFQAFLEQLELAPASWPSLFPADKLLTRSQTAFEDQVSSFACCPLSPL